MHVGGAAKDGPSHVPGRAATIHHSDSAQSNQLDQSDSKSSKEEKVV